MQTQEGTRITSVRPPSQFRDLRDQLPLTLLRQSRVVPWLAASQENGQVSVSQLVRHKTPRTVLHLRPLFEKVCKRLFLMDISLFQVRRSYRIHLLLILLDATAPLRSPQREP